MILMNKKFVRIVKVMEFLNISGQRGERSVNIQCMIVQMMKFLFYVMSVGVLFAQNAVKLRDQGKN